MNETQFYTPTVKKARIEIIPLIDVVFFLLATFVLFTLSLDRIASIGVVLPKSGDKRTGEDSTAYIQASDQGAYYWKVGQSSPSELISAAEIPLRLASYKRSVAEPRVLIRGDRRAKFSATVSVLDQVRMAGITAVSFETLTSSTGN